MTEVYVDNHACVSAWIDLRREQPWANTDRSPVNLERILSYLFVHEVHVATNLRKAGGQALYHRIDEQVIQLSLLTETLN